MRRATLVAVLSILFTTCANAAQTSAPSSPYGDAILLTAALSTLANIAKFAIRGGIDTLTSTDTAQEHVVSTASSHVELNPTYGFTVKEGARCKWKCQIEFFGTNDGCDCECSTIPGDPDCRDPDCIGPDGSFLCYS
jgi:hypothetical protein